MNLAGYQPTLNEVAALFGKSSRWIAELRAAGAMPGEGATLKEFVDAWAAHRAAGGGGPGGNSREAALTRKIIAEADLAEMKNAQMRLELLSATSVTSTVQAAFARVRAKLLALPSRAAPIVFTLKSAMEVQGRISELVHEALAELAETEVVTASAEPDAGGSGNGAVSDGVVEGIHAPAEADRKPVGRRKPPAKPRGKRGTGKVGHKPR